MSLRTARSDRGDFPWDVAVPAEPAAEDSRSDLVAGVTGADAGAGVLLVGRGLTGVAAEAWRSESAVFAWGTSLLAGYSRASRSNNRSAAWRSASLPKRCQVRAATLPACHSALSQ